MSKNVVYQSGGFTNCGIGYRQFSLEELEEMKKEDVKCKCEERLSRNQKDGRYREKACF